MFRVVFIYRSEEVPDNDIKTILNYIFEFENDLLPLTIKHLISGELTLGSL